MKYHILFNADNKSIQFQGDGGVVNPSDILENGRIVKNVRRNEIRGSDGYFVSIDDVDVVFIPD